MIILFNSLYNKMNSLNKKELNSDSSKLNYFIKRKVIKDVPELKLLNNEMIFNDILNFTKNEKRTVPKITQTDLLDYNEMEKMILTIEEERDKLKVDKLSLNNEIEKYISQIKELKNEINEMKKLVSNSNQDSKKKDLTIEKLTNTSIEYRAIIESLNKEILKLKLDVDESKKKNERLENELKLFKKDDKKKKNENNEKSIFENSSTNEGFLIKFFKQKLINKVVKYLNIEDIANLKLVNSVFCDSIERDNELNSIFLNKIIRRKNDKIVMILSDKNAINIQEEYNVNNSYVEELIQK